MAFAHPAGLVGLTAREAADRLATVGPNRLVERERWKRLRDLAGLFADPMALMLGIAGTLYLLLGETRDGVVLLCALVPVIGVDVLLELRSRQALEKLAQATRPTATVLRDGREVEVACEALVPGDLLLMREGDVLHADGVVRWSANLAADESQLTGEPDAKDKTPGDAFFAGSHVLAGHGYGEIGATGPRTQFGKIAGLVASSEDAPTPLQQKTSRLVRGIALGAVGVAAAVFALGIGRGLPLGAAFLSALSLAISALPEEYPLVFTLYLSLGAWRLASRGVLVRRLASIETLGATTVICVDKTGTLTAGQFALDVHRPLGPDLDEHGVLEAAVLACEPAPSDPMERVILAHCAEHGVDPHALHAAWKLVHDYPFEPVGRHMTHVWSSGDRSRLAAKGALEGILEHCDVSPGERAAAEAAAAELASQGYRVLGVAGREGAFTGVREDDERGLKLVGLLGFVDPLRPEVPAAIAECQAAGVRVKLITGDNALTAHAVAERAGIAHHASATKPGRTTPTASPAAGGGTVPLWGDDLIVTGDELMALPQGERDERVRHAAIFARVRPEQKHAIVDALVTAGEIVAMTGDGINDAPALRRANIGVAMGRRGTEVARGAADLVLLEDDFAALVGTIAEGRRIYANVERAFLYLIGFKLPIVGLALLVPILGMPLLLLPVHLVWLELIVHPISALAFEGEPAPPDAMRRPPRDPKAPLLPHRLVLASVVSGVLLTAAALFMYHSLLPNAPEARSAALVVIVTGDLFLVWTSRALDRPWWRVPLPREPRFWFAWGAAALTLPAMVALPALASLLQMAPLSAREWATAIALAAGGVFWRSFATGRSR